MTGFTDWTNLGIFPLQDHEPDVPLHIRQTLVGGRIARLGDEDSVPESLVEYALDDDKGTLGDLHPWLFWQTADRDERGMGSWSMAWAGLTVEDTRTKRGPTTGPSGGDAVAVLPIRDDDLTSDPRYIPKTPGWPKCFPTLPKGTTVMVMPATEEGSQKEITLHADPRMIAVNTKGPATHGSLVVDLQGSGEPCMDDSDTPGIGGRHARLQSMMRVVPLSDGGAVLGSGIGNGLAWNLALGGVDKLAGYGMVFARVDGGGTGAGGAGGRGGGKKPGEGETPCDSGRFSPSPSGGHGVSFMAHVGACGPFHAGHATDKHQIGFDRDGNPMNSGHLSTEAYFYRDRRRDGPVDFEDEYPDPVSLPLLVKAHIGWDDDLPHKWIRGTKQGKWRLWAETHVFGPTTNPPGTKVPPGRGPTTGTPGAPGPTTPGPSHPGPTPAPIPRGPTTGGPTTGGPGGSEPTTGPGGPGLTPGSRVLFPDYPGGWLPGGDSSSDSFGSDSFDGFGAEERDTVGATTPDDRGLYSLMHPMSEGFASMVFRPQFWQEGFANFEHSKQPAETVKLDEAARPQVLAMRAWGGQLDGEWDYATLPFASRARGGVTAGGILYTPPQFEMEDYFQINSQQDVRAYDLTAPGYVTCAPGLAFALGTPHIDGGLEARSAIIGQNVVTNANDPFLILQLNASRESVVLFSGELDQTTAEVVVNVGTGGTQAARIPRGTTAQRPSAITPTGGEVRINTDLESGVDTPEFYDAQTDLWFPMGGGPLRIPFTATDVFAYRHGRGADPVVQVIADSHLIETCVDYPDSDTVVIHFSDTITGGTLLLS